MKFFHLTPITDKKKQIFPLNILCYIKYNLKRDEMDTVRQYSWQNLHRGKHLFLITIKRKNEQYLDNVLPFLFHRYRNNASNMVLC